MDHLEIDVCDVLVLTVCEHLPSQVLTQCIKTPKRICIPFGMFVFRDRARERLPWPPRAERDRPFARDRRSIIDFRGDSLLS